MPTTKSLWDWFNRSFPEQVIVEQSTRYQNDPSTLR